VATEITHYKKYFKKILTWPSLHQKMRKTTFLVKGQKKIDSLILWHIISVLLQRLPAHHGTMKPPPHAQLSAYRNFLQDILKCPQHKLNLKQCSKKQTDQTDKILCDFQSQNTAFLSTQDF